LAVDASETLGRVYPEPTDALRDPFEVDRQRILASAAFRRLQYKTQVFVNVEHDHFRTRLTHTLEVAEAARRLAVALGANERLAEVVALAHDLGHPPFGHAGEAALRALMANAGGFEHNVQSLRVVDYLEHPYPEFRGLNLSFEVREGLIKHRSAYDAPDAAASGGLDLEPLFAAGRFPSVEGQIASAADRIAYDCHDLEDAVGAGLIDEKDLNELNLWREAAEPVRARHRELSLPAVRRPILSGVVDRLLTDVIRESRRRATRFSVTDVDSVRRCDSEVIAFSQPRERGLHELERFLTDRVYRHERVGRADAQARATIERLFAYFATDADRLPPRFAARVPSLGFHRVVCDYIAGMTDRFCQYEHDRLG
jgi:dGTPase